MGDGQVKFNLQTFLSEMRQEQREAHAKLLDTISDHETRIVVMENAQGLAKWLGGAMVLAFLGGCVDVIFNHIPKFLGALSGRP